MPPDHLLAHHNDQQMMRMSFRDIQLEPHEKLMGDKAFTPIRHLFTADNSIIPIVRNNHQGTLNRRQKRWNSRIAKVRIGVENYIKYCKQFSICSRRMRYRKSSPSQLVWQHHVNWYIVLYLLDYFIYPNGIKKTSIHPQDTTM